MKKNKSLIYLGIIFLIALVLRTWRLYPNFFSSDIIQLPLFVIDSFPTKGFDSFLLFSNNGIGNPLRLIVYPYSVLQPILYFVIISFYSLLKIPLTEFNLLLPTILIGAFTIFPLYYLIKELSNKRTALITCLFLAILPNHIIQSRYLSAARALAFLLQVLTVYWLVKYFKYKNDKFIIYSSIFLSLCILSSIIFPPFLMVVLFIIIFYSIKDINDEYMMNKNVNDVNCVNEKRMKSVLRQTLNHLLKLKFIILPILTIFFLILILAITINLPNNVHESNVTMLGHAMSKQKEYGFFLIPVMKAIYENVGISLFILIIASIISLIFSCKYSTFKKERLIFLGWGIIYLLPFLFIKASIIRVYLFYSSIPLVIYSIVFLCSIFESSFIKSKIVKSKILKTKIIGSRIMGFKKKTKILFFITLCLISILTIFSSISSAQNILLFKITNLSASEGSYHEDIGLKTAGVWIRENTNKEIIIFTDSLIEPPNAKYYFNRKIYSLFDSNKYENYKFFLENKPKIDLIVIFSENEEIFKNGLNNFHKILSIEKNGKAILSVLSKKKRDLQILDVDVYNNIFDKKYANLESLRNAPNYVSQFPAWI